MLENHLKQITEEANFMLRRAQFGDRQTVNFVCTQVDHNIQHM